MIKTDNKSIYDKLLKDKVKDIIQICNEYKIPAFMTFAVTNSDVETEYTSDCLTTQNLGMTLTDDKFIDLINVMNNFTTVPKKELEEMNF